MTNFMKKDILSLIIVLLIVSCSSDKKANTRNNIKASLGNSRNLHLPESGEDTLKVSYFADTVLYVPLEASRESFLGVILQVWINDSLILVSSWKEGLFLFRKDGKFIRKIGKKGKGPGEYLGIFHFDVLRDTIYISSTGKRGFLRYTFDGIFCDNIDLNYQLYFSAQLLIKHWHVITITKEKYWFTIKAFIARIRL